MYIYTYIYVYIFIHIYICIYICKPIYTSVHAHICICIYMHIVYIEIHAYTMGVQATGHTEFISGSQTTNMCGPWSRSM